jgi:hypothetical protein
MDPDPYSGGPKTSGGSGSATLVLTPIEDIKFFLDAVEVCASLSKKQHLSI